MFLPILFMCLLSISLWYFLLGSLGRFASILSVDEDSDDDNVKNARAFLLLFSVGSVFLVVFYGAVYPGKV